MVTTKQYRAKSNDYGDLIEGSNDRGGDTRAEGPARWGD